MKIVDGILIQSIKEHKEIKQELLKRISKAVSGSYKTVSVTDWHKDNLTPRTYFTDILEPLVRHYYNNIKEYYYKNFTEEVRLVIDNFWFQIYKKNSSHKWHTHPGANFGNVYYVELPNNNYATKFLNTKNINVKEGDMITFPAFLAHTSPINLDDKQKTIISFNTSFSID